MSSAPLSQRLHGIVTALLLAVGVRVRVLPQWATAFLSRRLNRLRRRATALLEQLQAGTYRAPRPRAPRTTPSAPRKRAQIAAPHQFGALGSLLPSHAGGAADDLRALLTHPDLPAHIATAPALGRHLRPLCNILGIQPPAWLRPPPAKPRPRARGVAKPPPNPTGPSWRALIAACRADTLARHFRASSAPPALLAQVFATVLTPEIRRLLAPEFKFLA